MMRAVVALILTALLCSAYAQKRVLVGMGNNAQGQLSQNDVSRPGILFSSVGGLPVAKMCTSVGQLSTDTKWRVIVINTQGDVYGWGNAVGGPMLGLGNTYPVTTTVLVTPTYIFSLGESARAITCGDRHTLITTASYKVYGFGYNDASQFAIPTSTNLTIPQPTRMPQFEGYANLWAIGTNTFAQTSGTQTRLFGVGANNLGQLGSGISTYIVTNLTELSVPNTITTGGTQNIVQVSGSIEYMFYLLSSGMLYVTGYDSTSSRLGLGTLGQTPAIITNFTLVTNNIGSITTQLSSSVAVSSDGLTTYSWGDNTYGQLCVNPSTTAVGVPTAISALSQQSFKVTTLAMSNAASMFITNNGQMFGCGSNSYNQLGVDWSIPGWLPATSSVPFQAVISSTVALSATSFVLSSLSSFLLTSTGIVYGWGRADNLGITYQFPNVTAIKPAAFSGLTIDSIYTGNQFSVVYSASANVYFGFGANAVTNILSNTSLNFFAPVYMATINGRNFTNLAVGGGVPAPGTTSAFTTYANIFMWNNASAVNSTANLFGIGDNDQYQLGLGVGTANSVAPQLYPVSAAPSSDMGNNTVQVIKVDAGFAHAGLLANVAGLSSIYLWGSNVNGQLGLRTLQQQPNMLRVTSNVIDMALGDYHSIYITETTSITTSGTVITYDIEGTGNSQYGQLGLGNLYYTTSFLPVGGVLNATASPFLNLTLVKVWTGADQTWIMTNIGVFVTGNNRYGQLGLGQNVLEVRQPILHPNFTTNVVQVACAKYGGSHTLVLLDTGDVYVMGRNDNGQLGLGDFQNRYVPTLLPRSSIVTNASSTDVIAVAAGYDHSLMIVGQRDCPDNCNGQGVCNPVTGICNCFMEFLGESCNLFQCLPTPNCNLHGYCDTSNGVCVCTPSALYTGISCEQRRCILDCSGRGRCDTSSGSCVCDPGYTGLGCQQTSGVSKNNLSWILALIAVIITLYL